jgi:hypothetical protein
MTVIEGQPTEAALLEEFGPPAPRRNTIPPL